uniref:Pregnancy zone protein n=1 Tax=Castor canadensis TaxID=51338 RepID=A0A8C0XNL6_CASCN
MSQLGIQLPKPVLILLFLLLPRDASATAKPQYVVLVPSRLYAGIPEKACVNLNHLNESVTLNVILEYETQSRNLLTDLVVEKNSFYCSPFTIPEMPSSSVFITVQVKGPTHHFIKRKPMNIIQVENPVFVQTDKPIYKPGQTVRFRIVSMDVNFHPLNETVSLRVRVNPKRSRIFQWQNLKLQGGLSQLSFPLSVEPILGSYKLIVMKESGKRIEHSFEVNEYVLPKFEVQVKMPKTIAFLEEEFEVSVCGLYTYGKTVPGLIRINACRRYSRYRSVCHGKYSQNICEEFSQQADNKGCFTQLIKTKIFQLRQRGYDMKIQVEATVREEGTGLELTGYGSSEITNTLSRLRFTKVDSHYRHGLPFFGQVLLLDEKDDPIPNKVVRVDMAGYHSNFTTNEHGLAEISIDTTNFTFSFTVTYKLNNMCFDNWWLDEYHSQAQHSINRLFSPSKSYVHLELVHGILTCGQTQAIRAYYILNEQILKDEKELTFYYLLKARGSIFRSGIHVLSIEQGNMKGVFSFTFQVESDIAPTAELLIYTILPDGEIVADTQKLDIENCFANKVHLVFSSAQSLPASDTHLQVTATPKSLCALRAIDQSMLLIKPEAELSPQSVSPISILDISKCSHNKLLRVTGTMKFHNTAPQPLPIASNAPGRIYPVIPREEDQAMQVRETVRKYFPETWIWDLVVLNSSGESELAVKVPDSITEWKASALCLSGTMGLGLSPIISLQVFQPFFLELTLPYSVVRGEAFTLKATVFNYLSHCIRVSVQLEVSSAFLVIPVKENEESHCVCGNGRKTLSWAVTPNSLGKVNFTATVEALQSQELCGNEVTETPELLQKDTVVKPLIVEVCEHTLKHFFLFPSFICIYLLLLDTGLPEKLSLKVPPNVVEGSARATYSVLGDILGSAMQNLQNLLQMPYGCGEQNMVLFVPNIYVLNYLNETQQLTEKIKSKAISYLINGYQRQLNYKHADGSYSTFGDRDGRTPGNTWLTAFVLKSFAQAQSHIFVESAYIMNALTWLSQRQTESGCFQRSGSLLNNAMKGGVDDEVTLSAYITIALLEMPLPVTHSIVRNALFCLEMAWDSISKTQESHVYTKALLAYAFALARNQAKRSVLLESLGREAIKEEDSIHWQRPRNVQETTTFYFQPRAPSAEVEMTSYVLLAYLTGLPTPSSEDLSVASRIVKWIIKQQNPNGGFSSTQDTVVALQALSKYGAATFTKSKTAALVTIKSSETFSQEFHIDDTNRLLLQEVGLPEIPGDYSTTVSGSGCVYLQTSLRYNILPKKEGKAHFTLQIDTLPKNCDGIDAQKKFHIHINISYTGERPSSNMVIVDVKMVSGFIPMKASVKKRTEVSNNHVLVYFEKLTKQILSFSFLVEQDIQVKNLKPAIVKAYDYYETDEFTIGEYSAPCSAGKV